MVTDDKPEVRDTADVSCHGPVSLFGHAGWSVREGHDGQLMAVLVFQELTVLAEHVVQVTVERTAGWELYQYYVSLLRGLF